MYRVKAVPRAGHTGRNRAGRRFETAHWTELPADIPAAELEAIRADPLLIVEQVDDGPEGPSELERLRTENASLREQFTSLQAAVVEAQELMVQLDGLPALKAELETLLADVQRQEAAYAALEAEAAVLRSELERVTAEREALRLELNALQAAEGTQGTETTPEGAEADQPPVEPAKKVLTRKSAAEK